MTDIIFYRDTMCDNCQPAGGYCIGKIGKKVKCNGCFSGDNNMTDKIAGWCDKGPREYVCGDCKQYLGRDKDMNDGKRRTCPRCLANLSKGELIMGNE